MLGFRPELDGDELLGARSKAMADIVAGDGEIASVIGDAAHKQVDVRIVGVPIIDCDPFELGPRSLIICETRSRAKAFRSVISAASSGEIANLK
jgi:hypothetical protein